MTYGRHAIESPALAAIRDNSWLANPYIGRHRKPEYLPLKETS